MEQNLQNDESVEELTDDQIDSLTNDDPLNQVMPEKATPAPGPVTFTANGKEISADVEQLKKWASQGYNYGQHMESFKREQEQFNNQKSDYENRFGTYEKIDQLAQQNPDWWNHVQESYKQNLNGGSVTQQDQNQDQDQEGRDYSPEVQELRQEFSSELEDLKKFKNEILSEKQSLQQKREDEDLEKEIQSIRETHSDLNWEEKDESGKSLEIKILEHAKEKGINSFDVAFKHYMHDELLNRAKQSSLDAARREVQRNHKIGLLGETPEPLKKMEEQMNARKSSWEDLEAEALKELGLA